MTPGSHPACSSKDSLRTRVAKEAPRRLAVPGLRDVALEHLAFVIDGTPEVVGRAVDLDEHFIEVPAHCGTDRKPRARFLRIAAAKIGPNRFHPPECARSDMRARR
jgi:hypothetical protein